ncbi:tyrosine-type recombinase/integrase [Geminisphaera colitermitum]|uniref:tyrosine-type recombinase/integrase n=1 Tax=Geminisphaera colitermitum TaxID=1148786 RepID=UPI000158CB92|nr:site-specific integrase [Geminisphaera colitermitum]
MPADTSIYKRKARPHWYISFIDPITGKRRHRATPFLIEDPTGHRKAFDLAVEKSVAAKHQRAFVREEAWENWAEQFITTHYLHRKTHARLLNGWRPVFRYLHEKNIRIPASLSYQNVCDYVPWRTAQARHSGAPIHRNTALFDVKVLGIVMREAVRRGYAQGNPCHRTGLKRAPAKQKPEMTDAEIAKIRATLAEREGHLPVSDRWMTVCFEVAIHQGCRLTETAVPMDAVDLVNGTIRFSAKGRGDGERKVFTTMLHPGLKPLIGELQEAGAKQLCQLPKLASKEWWLFFRELKMPHLCFHCTRVTVVTRLARAGVPIQQAMRFVGHASEIVHRIYQRLQAPDLTAAVAALGSLSASVSDTGAKE